MKKSKKIFLAIVILFLLGVIYITYDISTRTTFPGSKNREPVDTVMLKENGNYKSE